MNAVKEFVSDIARAFALLSRLPIRADFEDAPVSRAVWAYPLVGFVIGAIAMAVGLVALTLGVPSVAAGFLALTVQVILTGAMHEDGLADTADGLWGGWTRERRLDIMRDSHIGAYGVLALVMSCGLRAVLLASLLVNAPWAIIIIAGLSRTSMACTMAALPNARSDGLSHATGRPQAHYAALAVGMALVVGALIGAHAALLAFLACTCATVTIGWIAYRKIGGQTGDILGATQVTSEIFALLTLVAMTA